MKMDKIIENSEQEVHRKECKIPSLADPKVHESETILEYEEILEIIGI